MSRTIVEAGLSFASIGPETMEPPQEWVAVLGPDAALRAFRLAKAAWLPSREAPAGLSIATDILKMDARVKAAKKGGSAPPLNVAIQVVMQPVAYPELEVDE